MKATASQIEVSNIWTTNQTTWFSIKYSAAPISEHPKTGEKTITTRKRGRRSAPRAASCASASIRSGKDFPVASGAVSSREDGKDRGEGHENATKRTRKGSKNSAILHVMWTFQAMVPRWTITVIQGSRGKSQQNGNGTVQ